MKFKVSNKLNISNLEDIKSLIIKLFKSNECYIKYVNIYGNDMVFFNVVGMNDLNITNIIYPFNIKHKSTLGFYDYETGITILPVNLKGIYKIKIGTCTNKPIRDLFSIIR